jgi:uncharacterized membrane protein (UPF0127 family)
MKLMLRDILSGVPSYITHPRENGDPWIPAYAGMQRKKLSTGIFICFTISIFALIVLLSDIAFAQSNIKPSPPVVDSLVIELKSGSSIGFQVEIADTFEKREKGLMGRDSLPDNHGMLFLFDEPSTPAFWMKDCKIYLDMIFIGADGLIKGIHHKAIPGDLTPIPSPEPVIAVLEILGGTSEKLRISKGDKVIHPRLEHPAQKDLK